MANKVFSYVRTLVGAKGTNGEDITSPTNPLDVQLSHQHAFSLIKQDGFLDNHVVKRDFDFTNGFIYIAYAPGASPSRSASVWNILREPLTGGLPLGDVSVIKGVAWDDRATETYPESVA